MAEAAHLPLPYPEAAVVAEETLAAQTLALASDLPDRPLVLGGCCCAHVGAVEGLTARYERLALVWLDAHGDLNTPATSPSGNAWGMPLRMLLDAGVVEIENTVLVGARNLDPPEEEFIASAGLPTGRQAIPAALAGADGVYVAVDLDVLSPGEVASHVPEPGGPTLVEVEELLRGVAGGATVVGVGLTGLAPVEENVPAVARVLAALGL
jgi:arginase